MEQNRELREAHMKSLHEMEELKRVEELRIDEFSRRRLIEHQDTTLELTASFQELQHEVNCMNDSRDFKDAESVRSGLSHVPSQPALLPPFRDPGGVFENPTASSSAPYRQGFNPWISNVSEHTSPHVMSESQTPALDQRCQSGPSARNSFNPSEGRFSKDNDPDQQRLQISDPHFDKFSHTSNIRLLEDKIQDLGMYLLTISYGSHAMDQRSGVG